MGIKSRGNFSVAMCLRKEKVKQCLFMDCYDDCEKGDGSGNDKRRVKDENSSQ